MVTRRLSAVIPCLLNDLFCVLRTPLQRSGWSLRDCDHDWLVDSAAARRGIGVTTVGRHSESSPLSLKGGLQATLWALLGNTPKYTSASFFPASERWLSKST